MMGEPAAHLEICASKKYNWKKQKIKCIDSLAHLLPILMNHSCLAHVINLATQMLILTDSKSPHYDPKQPDAHIPTLCDEVGLVRAIVVKVWFILYILGLSLISPTMIQEHSSSK